MKTKLLLEHLNNCKEQLLQFAKHAGILEHKGNLGTVREGFIKNFLEDNLPENIKYHSGEIFDSNGNQSGQIDIVLHPISSPKLFIHKAINLFPIETVLAAIEVKSNLNDISSIVESCKKVRDLQSDLPYIAFRYQGNSQKTLIENMQKKLANGQGFHVGHLPNIIVVLRQNYCLVRGNNWHHANATVEEVYSEVLTDEKVLLGLFSYLLKLIEEWSAKPEKHSMPIKKYLEDKITLDDWI